MQPYGIALSYEATGTTGRCGVKACAYPGRGIVVFDQWRGTVEQRIRCWWHFLTDSSPLSIEYEDADALCGVPRHTSRAFDGKVRIVSQMTQGAWNSARVAKYSLRGWGSHAIARIVRKKDESAATHLKDPAYAIFPNPGVRLIYAACGEKFHISLLCNPGDEPTCDTCLRIYTSRLAELAPVPLRPGLITPAKPKQATPSFVELVAAGVLDSNEVAFLNRRSWGDRGGRSWNDPALGVQRDPSLRWDRGGVNRKRG